MKTYTLDPVNGRKSFKGKCRVIDKNGLLQLESYNTIVAEYNKRTDEVKVFGWYSKTTKTHIDSFLSYLNVPAISKKDITDGKYTQH